MLKWQIAWIRSKYKIKDNVLTDDAAEYTYRLFIVLYLKLQGVAFWQAPFNTVTVSAIGDGKALTYFRLQSNGHIVVNSDLKADPDTQYLVRYL